ncbi:MAG TPA: HAMP domain-containing protein, partial [Kofleriaceae bacterium]|nr:HAMP domain-containing protein [Kofleriaceae bacterium]
MTTRPLFRTLAGRLVVLGVLQLLLLAATAVAIFFAEGPHEQARPWERIDRPTTMRLAQLVDRPDELTAALDDLHRERIEVSLYDSKRQLLASNVDPPLAIPSRPRRDGPPPGFDGPPPGLDGPPPGHDGPPPGPMGHLADGERPPHAMVIAFLVHGERGYLVARGVHADPPGWTGPILTFLCGLVVLVLGALVTARWIVKPIERLSTTARALGTGDLRARSRLVRGDEIGELG